MNETRREFLKLAAAGIAAGAVGSPGALAQTGAKSSIEPGDRV